MRYAQLLRECDSRSRRFSRISSRGSKYSYVVLTCIWLLGRFLLSLRSQKSKRTSSTFGDFYLISWHTFRFKRTSGTFGEPLSYLLAFSEIQTYFRYVWKIFNLISWHTFRLKRTSGTFGEFFLSYLLAYIQIQTYFRYVWKKKFILSLGMAALCILRTNFYSRSAESIPCRRARHPSLSQRPRKYPSYQGPTSPTMRGR